MTTYYNTLRNLIMIFLPKPWIINFEYIMKEFDLNSTNEDVFL